MTRTDAEQRQPLSVRRVVTYGLIAIVVSTVANLIVRAVGMELVDVSPEFLPLADMWRTRAFTIVFVFAAVVVFAIVDRLSSKPAKVFNIIAFIAFLVSLVPDTLMLVSPANMPFGGISPATVLILMIQHLCAYLITIYTLTVLAYRT